MSAPPFRSIRVIHLCLNGRPPSELPSTGGSWAGGDVRSCDPGSYVNHQQRLACGPLIPLLLQTPAIYSPGPRYSEASNREAKLRISRLPPSGKTLYFKMAYGMRTDRPRINENSKTTFHKIRHLKCIEELRRDLSSNVGLCAEQRSPRFSVLAAAFSGKSRPKKA